MTLNDNALCTFVSLAPSLLLETLLVQQWQGEEGLSQPYRFEVRLATLNPLFDDEALLGNRAVLTLSDAKGLAHPYHGIVTAVDYLDADSRYYYYRVVLEPRMVRLRHFRFSEIWLDKSLPELIRDVLKLADLKMEGPGTNATPDSVYDFDIRMLSEDVALTQATFTCQYEESSFTFLSRLLEYFGVYYYFEQSAEGEALVLCGDRRFQPQAPSLITYRRHDSDLDIGQGLAVARSFERKLAAQPSTVTLQDFSPTSARLQLRADASVGLSSLAADATAEQRVAVAASAAFVGEQGLYGEHFGSQEQGKWLATLRAQAIGCRYREFHGSGRASGLRAGYPMLLAGHPRLPFNTRYQVIQVQHEGHQPLPGLGQEGDGVAQDVNTRFIALPEDVQFRTPNLTRKPHVQGMLSAVVDGDADTGRPLLNKHGCYKVSFPFIRGEKTATHGSAWVRMATVSNGSSHGMAFPLLKGTEVLLSFLGGDPDRPVITGSVPNSENPARVTMSNATQSGINTPGGHYLAMEDSASGPMMRMGAPVGNTKLTLGEGSVSGAELQTDNHMQLTSGSYKQQVSNMYFHSMGGGLGGGPSDDSGGTQPGGQTTAATDTETEKTTDPTPVPKPEPDPAPAPEPKKPHDYFPDFSHTGKFQDYQIAPSATFTPSWSIKMDATLEQTAASIGVMKQGLSAMGWEIAVSIAGPKSTWAISWGSSEFKSGFKNTYATRLEQVLNSKKVYMTSEDKAVNKRVETGTYIQESVALTKISCGPHSIAVTPAGIIISSPVPITFDCAVHVLGDSVVIGDLAAVNLSAMEAVKAGLSVTTTQLKASNFELGAGRTGLMVPPSVLTKEIESFTAAKIAQEGKAYAVRVSSAVNQTAAKLNELAQDARDAAGIAPA